MLNSTKQVVGLNNSSKSAKVLIGDLTRRDGQQSTISPEKMIWDLADLAEMSKSASLVGIDYQETNGGNFPSAAMQNGINPFKINQQVSELTAKALTQSDNSDKIGFTSSLFRGKSAYSFSTYTPDFIEANFRRTIEKADNKLIRVFDGLNDADSIIMTDTMLNLAKEKGVNIQGAIATGPSLEQLRGVLPAELVNKHLESLAPDQRQALENLHSDEYYINYAKLLLEKGFDSFVIKDLSGAFDAQRIKVFVPKLKAAIKQMQETKTSDSKIKDHDIPIYLHYHSTNESKSKEVVAAAIEAGIEAVETVNGPLGGGTGHLRISDLENNDKLVYSKKDYDDYTQVLEKLTGEAAKKRLDDFGERTKEILELLESMRLAGGSAASAITNAKKLAGIKSIDNSNIDKFKTKLECKLRHIAWMHLLMGLPPEVTPIPKMKTTQAIQNLLVAVNNPDTNLFDIELFKNGFDSEMVKFLNGHFGKVKAYITNEDGSTKTVEVHPAQTLKDVLEQTIAAKEVGQRLTSTQSAYLDFPPLRGMNVLDEYSRLGISHLKAAEKKAEALIKQYGIEAISFADKEDLGLLAEQAQVLNGKSAIDTAITKHSKRINASYTAFAEEYLTGAEKKNLSIIPNLKYLFAPLFDYFNAMIRTGIVDSNTDIRDLKLTEFGETAKDLKPVIDNITEHLAKLDPKIRDLKDNYMSLKVSDLVTRFSTLINFKEDPKNPLESNFEMHKKRYSPDKATENNIILLRMKALHRKALN